MVKSKDSILKDYQNSVEIQQNLITAKKKALNHIALSRLGLFVVELVFVAIIISWGYYWPLGVLMCVPVLCFLVLVKRQVRVQYELNDAEKLLFIFQNEVDVMCAGHNKYNDGRAFANESHPYASDLDIYGKGSLYAFINRSNTVDGMQLLANHLGAPIMETDIVHRQQAIAELTRHIDQTFHFRAGLQNHKPEQLQVIAQKLADQMPGQLQFIQRKVLRIYTLIAPLFSLGLLILGSVYGGAFWQAMALVLLFNASLTFFYLKEINQVYYGFSGGSGLLNAISGTIKWTEELKWESSYIRSFVASHDAQSPLSVQIKELSGIIQSFDIRLNVLLASFFNLFLLWDFRCTLKLDKWQKRSSGQLISGLYTISQFEELISFATLNYNEPEWVFPAISDDFALEAEGIGHPLITAGKRVINDYHFGGRPTVDIVTGSNMAGKSTFLRTAGINMVLAYAGAPVCAAKMKVSIFELLTYMRIKDSLNDQTSTFKAELNRLKMILAGVHQLVHPLVLIDEMLRGTNSKDKYLGSKVFIQKMITEKTPALFATHDLQLSEMEGTYPEQVRNYHFDIQLEGSEMNFDYKLKDGACKTFNAAILLKEIGLSFNPNEDFHNSLS